MGEWSSVTIVSALSFIHPRQLLRFRPWALSHAMPDRLSRVSRCSPFHMAHQLCRTVYAAPQFYRLDVAVLHISHLL